MQGLGRNRDSAWVALGLDVNEAKSKMPYHAATACTHADSPSPASQAVPWTASWPPADAPDDAILIDGIA